MTHAPTMLAGSGAPISARRPQVYLELADADGTISCVPLDGPRLTIGRGPGLGLRLDHITVSRRHAELVRDPFGRWWVHDLGSRNGVHVNGERVPDHPLRAGDAVRVGKYVMTFRAVGELPLGVPGALAEELPVEVEPIAETRRAGAAPLPEVAAGHVTAAHLAAVVNLGHQLAEIEDINHRLRALCRGMVEGTFPGRCAIALRLSKAGADEPSQVLCPPQWRATPGIIDGEDRRGMPYISRSVLRALREEAGPVIASNVLADVGVVHLSLAAATAAMTVLACPLRDGERTLDALYVVLPPESGTAEWLAVASLAARQYQQAATIWASHRQAEAHAAIERELQRARQIQMRLVPRRMDVPGLDVALGFEPCQWVAGDYVDVVEVGDGRVLLTVADVSGKGLEAAMTMSSLHAMVHLSVRAGVGLTGMVKAVAAHLREFLPADGFVTMLCVLFDTHSGELECVNAGHPPAMVIGRGGEWRELQAAANMPLGVGDEPMELQESILGKGELLAMYTDGLTDIADENGKLLGSARLKEMIRASTRGEETAADVAEALRGRLDAYRGGELAQDDRTFLLARRV